MTRRRGWLLLIAASAVCVPWSAVRAAAPPTTPTPPAVPARACARSNSPADVSAFFASGASGLVGGDMPRSYPMSDGRVLWTLQDAFVGAPASPRLDAAGFAHNVALVQSGRCFRVLTGPWTGTDPGSFVGATDEEDLVHWWWALHGEMGADGNLHVFYAEFLNANRTGAAYGATPGAVWQAVIRVRDLAVLSFARAPDAGVMPMYGFSIASDDQWTYLYGSCYRQFTSPGFLGWFDLSCNRDIRVARVPKGQFQSVPSYWNGSTWTSNRAAAAVIHRDGALANPLQVARLAKRVWVATSWLDDWFGGTVAMYTAPSPTGPFTKYAEVPVPTTCGTQCTNYFTSFVPGRTAAGDLVVSLSNYTWDRQMALAQPALYRPSVVTVPSPPSVAAAPFVFALDGSVELQVAGRGGIEPAARSAALNVSVLGPSSSGYVTVWPCGTARPFAASLNFARGVTSSSSVLAALGVGGRVCIYSSSKVDLLVHAEGWNSPTSVFHAVTPTRVLDTRQEMGLLLPGQVVEVPIVGRAGVDLASRRVALSVGATGAWSAGYVTVWQCGAVPPTSNVNVTVGRTVSNAAIVPLSARGSLCVRASAPMHVVLDVQGWWAPGNEVRLGRPARVLDTRRGAVTTDGLGAPRRPLTTAVVQRLPLQGRAGVTAGEAVVLNVTTTRATRSGILTVWPCASARPSRPTVRFTAGTTTATLTLSTLDARGDVCVAAASAGAVDVVADLLGWFPAAPGGYEPLVAAPLLDTRN